MVEHARAVVIGGGVGGTSIAYHLAARGWRTWSCSTARS